MPGTRTCTPHQVSFEGTVWVEAEVDLADALDLDTALSVGAARLADLGSTAIPGRAPLRDARGDGPAPARPGPRHHRHPTDTGETATPAPTRPGRWCCTCTSPTRRSRPPMPELHLARVANTRSFVDAEQVRTWCGLPGTTVTVKPVVDLAEHLHVDQYQVPDRLADQATERDVTCVFPWCTRPAENCDLDHVIPYAEGGQTASDNLGPVVPAAPPAQDPPLRLGLHGAGTRVLPVVLTARLPVPARPPRHHRRHPRPGHAPARRVATPPHTPRQPPGAGPPACLGSGGPPGTTSPTQPASTSVGCRRTGTAVAAAGGERKRRRGGDEVPNPSDGRRRHGIPQRLPVVSAGSAPDDQSLESPTPDPPTPHGGQIRSTTRPMTASIGTAPNVRESTEPRRWSPRTNTAPAGTRTGPK